MVGSQDDQGIASAQREPRRRHQTRREFQRRVLVAIDIARFAMPGKEEKRGPGDGRDLAPLRYLLHDGRDLVVPGPGRIEKNPPDNAEDDAADGKRF